MRSSLRLLMNYGKPTRGVVARSSGEGSFAAAECGVKKENFRAEFAEASVIPNVMSRCGALYRRRSLRAKKLASDFGLHSIAGNEPGELKFGCAFDENKASEVFRASRFDEERRLVNGVGRSDESTR